MALLPARHLPFTIFATVFLILGVLLCLTWWMERKPPELLWFAGFLLTSVVNRANRQAELLLHSHPFNSYGVPSLSVISLSVSLLFFATFVIVATGLRLRWLLGLLWTAHAAWVVVAIGPGSIRSFRAIGALAGAVAAFAIAMAFATAGREMPRHRPSSPVQAVSN